MEQLENRLSQIEGKIKGKDFREIIGLGNEVGYYIFDYHPQSELLVRNHVKHIKDSINKTQMGFQVIEFDLYEMVIDILKNKGYLEKCFEFEKTKGIDHTIKAITNVLRLTNKDNLIVNQIINNTPKDSVVFITGIGKCYPIIRSHNILNNLHQVMDEFPVVMFFPGEYSGQELQLFGTIKDDNYYRAFKLV